MRAGKFTGIVPLLGGLLWLLGACASAPTQNATPNDPPAETQSPWAPQRAAAQPPQAVPRGAPGADARSGPRAGGSIATSLGRHQAALPDSGAEGRAETLPGAHSGKLEDSITESFTGLASWYGRRFHGRRTASGEHYDMAALTAAHKTLPFGSRVRVTNLDNGRSVVVVINDRGPFVKSRVIDLSQAAAKRLGFLQDGLAKVRIEVLGAPTG